MVLKKIEYVWCMGCVIKDSVEKGKSWKVSRVLPDWCSYYLAAEEKVGFYNLKLLTQLPYLKLFLILEKG